MTERSIYFDNQVIQTSYNTDIDFFKWGGSVQLSKSFFEEKMSLSAGVRSDANNYSKSMQNLVDQLSPRISLSYKILPELNLNLNAGKYYKLPAYTSLGFKNSNNMAYRLLKL